MEDDLTTRNMAAPLIPLVFTHVAARASCSLRLSRCPQRQALGCGDAAAATSGCSRNGDSSLVGRSAPSKD